MPCQSVRDLDDNVTKPQVAPLRVKCTVDAYRKLRPMVLRLLARDICKSARFGLLGRMQTCPVGLAIPMMPNVCEIRSGKENAGKRGCHRVASGAMCHPLLRCAGDDRCVETLANSV